MITFYTVLTLIIIVSSCYVYLIEPKTNRTNKRIKAVSCIGMYRSNKNICSVYYVYNRNTGGIVTYLK